MGRLTVAVTFWALTCGVTHAQSRGPTSAQLSARGALAKALKTGLTVRWDPVTGAPASVVFRPHLRLPARLQAAQAERAARRVLYRLRRLYGVAKLGAPKHGGVTLARAALRRLGPWTQVELVQKVGATPVDGARVRVVLSRLQERWVVLSVAGRVFNDVPADAGELTRGVSTPRTVLTRRGRRWQLARWVANARRTREHLLDARGELLRSRSLVNHGVLEGLVYDAPGSTSLQRLGDLTIEVDGAAVTTDAQGRFAGASATVPGALRGPYERVVQSGTAHQVRDGKLSYASSDRRADEVSAFAHLAATRRWLAQYADLLGGLERGPIQAQVHARTQGATALLERAGGVQVMELGWLNGQSTARDGSIVSHERFHLLMYAMGFFAASHEANGIHEGIADYLAASRRNDPRVGGATGRTLSTLKVWPRDGGAAHLNGWIFGGALWDARQALGATVVDRLTLAAIPLLHANSTLLEGRDALLAADRRLHEGRHAEALVAQFLRHGIGEGEGAPPRLALSPAQAVLMPGDGPLRIEVSASDPDGKGCRVVVADSPFVEVLSHTAGEGAAAAKLELQALNVPERDGIHQVPVTAIDGDGRETVQMLIVMLPGESVQLARSYQVEVGETQRHTLAAIVGKEHARQHRGFRLAGNVSTRAELIQERLVLAPRPGEEGRHRFFLAAQAAGEEHDSLFVQVTVDVGSGPVLDVEGGAVRPGQELTVSAGGTTSFRVDAFWDARRASDAPGSVSLTASAAQVSPPSERVRVGFSKLPPTGTADPSTHLLVYAPADAASRVISLTLSATRSDGATTRRSLRIRVLPAQGKPPSLTVAKGALILDGVHTATRVKAHDPDSRGVRLAVEVLPVRGPAPTPTLRRIAGQDPPAKLAPPAAGALSVVGLGAVEGALSLARPGPTEGERVLVALVLFQATDLEGLQTSVTIPVYGFRAADAQAPAATSGDPTPASSDEERRGARGALEGLGQ